MSRIGRKPIAIPSGVEVKVAGSSVSVKGPLGKLDWSLAPGVAVTVDEGKVQVSRAGEDRKLRALHGLVRAELNNMIHGVTKGYERSLEITGVGYKTQLQGRTMSFN
ncbi:MAG: 50S ribosomal protein L6, partial [Fimbriimonadaceae bacterium]